MQHKWHIQCFLNVRNRLRWVHSTQFYGNWTHIGWDMDLWSCKRSAPNHPGATNERCRGRTSREIGSRVDLYACAKIVKLRARKWSVFWHRYWQNIARKVPCLRRWNYSRATLFSECLLNIISSCFVIILHLIWWNWIHIGRYLNIFISKYTGLNKQMQISTGSWLKNLQKFCNQVNLSTYE